MCAQTQVQCRRWLFCGLMHFNHYNWDCWDWSECCTVSGLASNKKKTKKTVPMNKTLVEERTEQVLLTVVWTKLIKCSFTSGQCSRSTVKSAGPLPTRSAPDNQLACERRKQWSFQNLFLFLQHSAAQAAGGQCCLFGNRSSQKWWLFWYPARSV